MIRIEAVEHSLCLRNTSFLQFFHLATGVCSKTLRFCIQYTHSFTNDVFVLFQLDHHLQQLLCQNIDPFVYILDVVLFSSGHVNLLTDHTFRQLHCQVARCLCSQKNVGLPETRVKCSLHDVFTKHTRAIRLNQVNLQLTPSTSQ